MKTLDVESFKLITMLNDDIDEIAEKAKLLSTLHILMPKQPSENLPAYTPIALVGDCGNLFGPTAYLPLMIAEQKSKSTELNEKGNCGLQLQ